MITFAIELTSSTSLGTDFDVFVASGDLAGQPIGLLLALTYT